MTQPVTPVRKSNPLINILGAHARRIIYGVYATLGLVLGSIQVWFGAVDSATPTWMKGAMAVFAYIGGAIGVTAAANASDSHH